MLLGSRQNMTLGMEAARHYAAAITLLRGLDDSPIDPATLAGADVATLMELNEAGAWSLCSPD